MIVDLRARVGQGTSTAIFTDAIATTCLNAALRVVNKRDPLWLFDSFTTTANQQRYTLTEVGVNATLIGAMEVFWRPNGGAGTCSTPGIFSYLGDLYDFVLNNLLGGHGQIPYVNESALELNARFNSVVQRYLGGRGWLEKDNFVYLEPRPSAGGDSVYFYAEIARFADPEDVTDDYAEALMAYAEYKAATLLAAQRGGAMSAQLVPGLSVKTDGGATYRAMADAAYQRFLDELALPADVHTI